MTDMSDGRMNLRVLGVVGILFFGMYRVSEVWQINRAASYTSAVLMKFDSIQLLFPCVTEGPIGKEIGSLSGEGERFFLYSGYGHLLQGQCEQASTAWENSLEINANNETTQFRLGLLYLQLEEFEKAYNLFQKLDLTTRQKLPNVLPVRNLKPENLLEVLEIAFWIHPSRTTVRRLDEKLTEANRGNEKWFYYDKLVELAPTDTFDYWWARGEMAYKQNNWQVAAKAYYSGLLVTPEVENRHWLYGGLANSFRQLGNDECANYFRMLLESGLYDESLTMECNPG